MQNPDDQIVSDSVWHELAFGLEQQGIAPAEMRLRIAEMANFFGMQTWFTRKCRELSGGQKQLLNLASVLVLKPELLILDEPCAQLDPIAADEFVHMLQRVNRELGVTIVLTDHRQQLILPLADRVLLLANGSLRTFPSAKAYASFLLETNSALAKALPAAARISYVVNPARLTLELRTVRELLREAFAKAPWETEDLTETTHEPAILGHLKELSFAYGKNAPLVLDRLSLAIPRQRILAILGGNGSGKSTLMHTIAGLNRVQSGKIRWTNGRPRIALLPQNARLLFTEETVLAQLEAVRAAQSSEERARVQDLLAIDSAEELLDRLGLKERMNYHPADLSGGELQRAALAVTLLQGAELLLLDEPSKGLDAEAAAQLAEILHQLCERGITIVFVSHDLDFCAEHADSCALLFQGDIVALAVPRQFFSGHYFYTTDASRIAQGFLDGQITVEEVCAAWQNRHS